MKKFLSIILLITAASTHAMVGKFGIHVAQKSCAPLLQKISTRKMNTSTYENYECALPLIRNPLGQVIAGVPVGWLGGTVGLIAGESAAHLTSIFPSILLCDILCNNCENFFDRWAWTGAIMGAIGGGFISSGAIAGRRGAISWGLTAAFCGIGYLDRKTKLLGIIKNK